MIEIDWRIQ